MGYRHISTPYVRSLRATVLNTYRGWLRYELFRGGLTYEGFRESENNLMQFVAARGNTKSHLADLIAYSPENPASLLNEFNTASRSTSGSR